MTTAATVCVKCGATIFADAPEGLCTACLFETGLDFLADETDEPANAGRARPPGVPKIKSGSTKTFADFGDYELLEVIGRGGQGVVYRARQKSLNRTVALKVIGLGHWAADAHLKRFRREAEAAASLDHSGIVPIYEVGERDGSCYFSMKFVEGGQLDAVVKREPMPMRQAVQLIAKVARTVHYAHEHGILHRDIKPGNILLDQKGEPHLTDFGLARLVETESTVTRTMEVLGTPSYMAPEQAVGNNDAVSSATDVYGLGAVLYQLLAGQPPFAGGTTYETIKLLLDTEPRQPRLWNPKIDRDLSTICLKCLEKDPKRRYSSALALAEDLERWLKHEPILARRTGIFMRSQKWMRRNPTGALLTASLVALGAAVGWIVWKSDLVRRPLTTGIAVLPFENLSDEKEDAFFADGVQDDILTKLAKIADLKVISRTSVMQYRGKQDVRQIGDALGVSHLLEGTVRRAGGKVRVNAQLIDTRTDNHVWAEEYDRDVSDIFAIQTEIAKKIADQLHAKLSPDEKAAIAKQPTNDVSAYSLYVSAAALIDAVPWTPTPRQDALRGVDFLNQAIARDPAFLLAYCKLARAHDYLYFGDDHTPERLALAESAVNSALHLGPNSGDAHLAMATHLYWGYLDYDRARQELAIAARALPNDPRVFELSGFIERRQGRWAEAVHELERAVELDPRNARALQNLATTYILLRAYKEASDTWDRVLTINPNAIEARLFRAKIDVESRGDTAPLHAVRRKVLTDDPALAEDLAEGDLRLALYERDPVAADRALAALDVKGTLGMTGFVFNHSFCEGLVARMKGNQAAATAAFLAARAQQGQLVRTQPDLGPVLCTLGMIDAELGRKQEALQEGRRAVELTPVSKNALEGTDVLYGFAVICAWIGERDLAFEQLQIVANLPAGPSYGTLRLDPLLDPLRGDPRFEKIVASLAPK
jgi:TolB-like protein/Tfp pilus assembly protein PilF/predicted Ser/Thr protein kinase